MTVTYIKVPHNCQLPSAYTLRGYIVSCDDCGRWWRAKSPGHPDWSKWKRAWVRQLLARRK